MCLLLLFLCVPARAAEAEDGRPQISGVRVGIGGRYRVGLWTPVEVLLRGGENACSGTLSLILPDGDGTPSRLPGGEVEIPGGGEASAVLYARFGRIESELTVELSVDGEVHRRVFSASAADGANRFPPAVGATRPVIVCLAAKLAAGDAQAGVKPLAVDVEAAVEAMRVEARDRPVVAKLEDCSQLPTRWYGYEGVDTLVLCGSRPEIFADLKAGDPRVAALVKWIRMGGRLLFCAGAEAEMMLGEEAPFGVFAPGPVAEMLRLQQASSLRTYCDSTQPIPRPAGAAGLELLVPRLESPRGVVERREADLSLVVRTPHGFGQVVFFAGDLDCGPLARWADRPLLIGKLLDLPSGRSRDAVVRSTVMRYGFDDVSGQLRSGLDQFGGMRLQPFWLFWLVAGLLLLYVLLLFPLEYLLLRKLAGRMRWTWGTFPVIVVGTCVGVWLLGGWLKGDRVRVNQVDLIDVDAESREVRGTSWMNVYSPAMDSFDLSFEPALPDGSSPPQSDVLLSWLGLPGDDLGGMDPRTADLVLWNEPYAFSPGLDQLAGVPIRIASTKSFTARWTARTPQCPTANLYFDGEVLSGTVRNTLDFPLSECWLVYDRWVYELGTLAPGQSAHVGPTVARPELRTVLTGRRMLSEDSDEEVATPYDQSSTDLAYILRTMMFFDAADGRQHTGLSHGYQHFVDCTDLLRAGRAVLVARAPADRPTAALLRDGLPMTDEDNQHVTYYRFVFPIGEGE